MLSFFILINYWTIVRLVMSRSTLLRVTAETQVGPLKQTSQMQKGGCLQRQVLQAIPSPATLWGVPGQRQDGAFLPRAFGALEAPDQEKHERPKGIPACATSKGLEAHTRFQTC